MEGNKWDTGGDKGWDGIAVTVMVETGVMGRKG